VDRKVKRWNKKISFVEVTEGRGKGKRDER